MKLSEPRLERVPVLCKKRRINFNHAYSYNFRVGGFFAIRLNSSEDEWIANGYVYCREEFSTRSHRTDRMLFVCGKGKVRPTAFFIRQIEKKLNLTVKTEIGRTQRADTIWIRLSPFWSETPMKRSLFTALLRAGTGYIRGGKSSVPRRLQAALDKSYYTGASKKAIAAFLNGKTEYSGKHSGWFNTFRDGHRKIDERVEKLLSDKKPSKTTVKKE